MLVLYVIRRRQYRVECTGSLPTSEVKRRRARSVLGGGTAWEHLRVLSAFYVSSFDDPAGCRILNTMGDDLHTPSVLIIALIDFEISVL